MERHALWCSDRPEVVPAFSVIFCFCSPNLNWESGCFGCQFGSEFRFGSNCRCVSQAWKDDRSSHFVAERPCHLVSTEGIAMAIVTGRLVKLEWKRNSPGYIVWKWKVRIILGWSASLILHEIREAVISLKSRGATSYNYFCDGLAFAVDSILMRNNCWFQEWLGELYITLDQGPVCQSYYLLKGNRPRSLCNSHKDDLLLTVLIISAHARQASIDSRQSANKWIELCLHVQYYTQPYNYEWGFQLLSNDIYIVAKIATEYNLQVFYKKNTL